MTTRWVRVELPWAVFGVAVRDGVVVDAAPIARWSIGKPEHQVASYLRSRGASFHVLPGPTPHRPTPGTGTPPPADRHGVRKTTPDQGKRGS